MANRLTVSCPSGRIFPRKALTNQEGLLLEIEFWKGIKGTAFYVDESGQEMIAGDSKGSLTQFLLGHNRFSCLVKAIEEPELVFCSGNLLVVASKSGKLSVFSKSGKQLPTFNPHKHRVKGFDLNYLKKYALSFSEDCVAIWDLQNWKKVRNMLAKGPKYTMARFSVDGSSVLTCFDDGKLYRWNLSNNELERNFVGSNLYDFVEVEGDKVLGIGKDQKLYVWGSDKTRIEYSLDQVPGIRTFTRVQHYQGNVLFSADNGRLYVLNIENARIEAEFQVGTSTLDFFQVKGEYLYTLFSNGVIRVHHFKKFLDSQIRARTKKLSLGLEENLVYTYLDKSTDFESYNFDLQTLDQSQLKSKEDVVFKKLSRTSVSSTSSEATSEAHSFKNLLSKAGTQKLSTWQLRLTLHHTSEYPEKYRPLIWRFILQLPGNSSAFIGLAGKGTHPCFVNAISSLPKLPKTVFSKVDTVVSALAYWSPLFAELSWLPHLVTPFAMVFKGDDLSCFETVMCIVTHWLQHWFDFFPSPAVVNIQSVENILEASDNELYLYLKRIPKLSEIIAEMLNTFLYSVVQHKDWAKLMDFIITEWEKPQLHLYCTAEYFLFHKNKILSLKKKSEALQFFKTKKALSVDKFMKGVFELHEKTENKAPVVGYDLKLPIPEGQYPVFKNYPKYTLQTKEDIARELYQEQVDSEKTSYYNSLFKDLVRHSDETEDQFKEKIARLMRFDSEKLKQIRSEEQARLEALSSFDAQYRKKKADQIKNLECENMFDLQENIRKNELNKLNQEMKAAEERQNYYKSSQLENEALNMLEYKASEKLFQTLDHQQKKLNQEAMGFQDPQELNQLKDMILRLQFEQEDAERDIKRKSYMQLKHAESNLFSEEENRAKEEYQRKISELERELKVMEVQKQRKMREVTEEEVAKHTEYLELIAQKEQSMKVVEQNKLREAKDQEHTRRLNQKIQDNALVAQEKRNLLQERLEGQKEAIKDQIKDSNREMEERILTLRKEQQEKALQEQRDLQQTLLEFEKERASSRQAQQDLQFTQDEYREKSIFETVLRETESKLKQDYSQQSQSFKDKLREELEDFERSSKESSKQASALDEANQLLKQHKSQYSYSSEYSDSYRPSYYPQTDESLTFSNSETSSAEKPSFKTS